MAKELKTNAMRFLDKSGINYEIQVYQCDEFIDGITVAEKLGQPADETFKTLIAQGKTGSYYCFLLPVAGGTILKTARSQEFMTPEGRRKAYDNMVEAGIDALVVIGGNGSLTGAQLFAREYDIPIIGLPGTIDNDLYGTDATIGYDSALNTIVECVDKIRDTANSHDRIFFIEVMGRDAGFLAQNSAIASGAEAAIIPESATDVDQLADFIERGKRKSKNSAIVLVSEAQKDGVGGAFYYADRIKKEYPQFDARVTILGHLQRGGTPSAYDRILASRMGYAAIEALLEGQRNIMIGIKNDEIVYVPIARAIKMNKPINQELITVLNVLSM